MLRKILGAVLVVFVCACLYVNLVNWLQHREEVEPRKATPAHNRPNFRTVEEPDRTVERLRIISGLRDLQRTSAAYYLQPHRRDMQRCDERAEESSRALGSLRTRAFQLSPPDQELEDMLNKVLMCMDCTPGSETAAQYCGGLYEQLETFH
jgi:hypothetical protein